MNAAHTSSSFNSDLPELEGRLDDHPPRVRRVITCLPPPDFADRCYRLAWSIVTLLLFRPSPVPLHTWRRMLLRAFGATISPATSIYPTARIWSPKRLIMHRGSCLGARSDCYNVALVELGERCVVSQKAYLCTASHDINDPSFALVGAPITVGADAWVAAAAFVGPGVSIGNGAVVAAAAVVTRDVAAENVVAGNPARIIRKRGNVA